MLDLKIYTVMLAFAAAFWPTDARYPIDKYGEFNFYVESFKEAGESVGWKVNMHGVKIDFVDKLPEAWVGVCIPEQRQVFVDLHYWLRTDETHREELVWHELGHCVLGREHTTASVDEHPASIMYPTVQVPDDEKFYLSHKHHYIKELFTTEGKDNIFTKDGKVHHDVLEEPPMDNYLDIEGTKEK